jgi:hypothetical protein
MGRFAGGTNWAAQRIAGMNRRARVRIVRIVVDGRMHMSTAS